MLRFLRHPFWTCGAILRLLTGRLVPAGLRTMWSRLWWNTTLFRLMPSADPPAAGSGAERSAYWIQPLRISGETLPALLAEPPSSSLFEMKLPDGACVVAACGLMPTGVLGNRGGIQFELEVNVPASGWTDRRTLHLDPRTRQVHRRWKRLTIELPPGDSVQDAVVRLTTRRPDGEAGGPAPAAWGEPHARWRKSPAQMRRTIVSFGARARRSGLSAALEQVRQLEGQSEEVERYQRWVKRHTPDPAALAGLAADSRTWPRRPLVSILTPVYNTDRRWLKACVESVRRQAYDNWELCLADDHSSSAETRKLLDEYERLNDPRLKLVRLPANGGISAASNAALAIATGEFVALLDHDDELAPEALAEMVRRLNAVPDADMVYSDEDKLDDLGERCDPYFKPDWSPEHFKSCMYTCHLMTLRTSLVNDLGGFRTGFEGSQDYDLVLRVMERTGRIEHVPKILYHWRKAEGSTAGSGLAKQWAIDAGERALRDHLKRTGQNAVVVPGPLPGLYRIRHRIAGAPLVSIVIPTSGRPAVVSGRSVNVLVNCLRSIAEKTSYTPYEIVLADDGSLSEETTALLKDVPHRLVHFGYTAPFNYARKLNFAVGHSRGEHLILLNDDIEVMTSEWIEAMLEYSQQQEVGAVGAKLLYPDGRLQHIGIVMGVCGLAAHAFHSHPGATPGYGGSALIVRNYSAVTAACMMTRRALYERLGGFDERFGSDFNDTDYCLRLRREGYRIVFTPHAELSHWESASIGARTWNAGNLETMRQTWAEVCERDPYYNPHLTRDFTDYRVRV